MKLLMRYASPAPDTEEGWEKYSMPIGNSYYGANIFGGVPEEHLQITENSVENPGKFGGLNSFADIYLHFPEAEISGYERGLCLDNAFSYVRYLADGTLVERSYFASYPDRCIIGQIKTSAPLNFFTALIIPFLTEEAGREKRGTVVSSGDTITMTGKMEGYQVRFSAQLKVVTNGAVSAEDGGLRVTGATESYFIFAGATNYELRPEVFLEQDDHKKLRDFDPLPITESIMAAASARSYDELLSRHLDDYRALFGRVSLTLGDGKEPEAMTDELLEAYGKGEHSPYLEALYFQFGRYLLIACSRPGCLPANLQGVWNCHDKSPWGSGYWHNINVQMNYWPAFVTNLPETFQAYLDYNLAFRPAAEKYARDYIRATVPEKDSDEPHACGWTIGTGNYSYSISGPGGHSGPGTGGLTSKLFWDAYSFTGDEKVLREVSYPALLSMAKFLLRCVRDYDGKYLSVFSASPEQILSNNWGNRVQYYHTVGCAFDQQMIWENAHDVLSCVEKLGWDNIPAEDRPVIEELREQLDRYDPVQVGWSGQIKEYREEHFYGEVGEYRHRHISQLVGLYPGTLMTSEAPAWRDAAKVSLNLRSDFSTGWALAHRLNAWARTGDGNRSYRLLSNLIGTRTLPNLWDFHPPFQIDGNFGGTSGVAEMLLQSHETYIAPLPSLPDAWKDGSFTGLVARGGFAVSAEWKNGCARSFTVTSNAGNVCRMKYHGLADAQFDVPVRKIDSDRVEFDTEKGKTYHITAVPAWEKLPVPDNLTLDRTCTLRWTFAEPVNVWRAEDSAPGYVLVAQGVTGGVYTDRGCPFDRVETVTYKLTRADTLDASADGVFRTLNHSTQLERERYAAWVRQVNLPCGDIKAEEYLGQ